MRYSQKARPGFTLIELVVVLAIAGLLLAILVPAVMRARASARTVSCKSNLRQIGLATHSYIDVHRCFPGGLYRSRGVLYDLLSFTENDAIYRLADSLGTRSERSAAIPVIPIYLCPEDPIDRQHDVTSYAINHGLLPALGGEVKGFLYEPVYPSDVKDGLSSTAFLSESITNSWRPWYLLPEQPLPLRRSRLELEDLCDRCADASETTSPHNLGGSSLQVTSFVGGYNHLLPPNAPACLFSPYPMKVGPPVGGHSGGVNVLLADGAVRYVSENIDRYVWWNVGTIDGGDSVHW